MTTISCPSCRKDVPSSAKFCPNCGASIAGGAPPAGTRSTGLRDTLIIAGAIVLAAVAYVALRQSTPKPEAPIQPAQSQSQVPQHPPIEGQSGGGMDMPQLTNLPTDYAGLVNAGNHNMDNGDFPMAAECYRRALALDGSSADVRTDYGACLRGMGLPQRALEEFRKVLAKDPKHTICIVNIGIVYNDLKQTDSARIYWKEYLELDPNGKAADQVTQFLKELGK